MQLQVRDLRCSWQGDGFAFTVVLPELCIKAGRPAALVGMSGTGKSTLLECLGLFNEHACFGSYTIGDCDLLALSPKRRALYARTAVGFMPQSGGLVDFLTVRANFLLQIQSANKARRALGLNTVNPDERCSLLLELCRQLGLPPRIADCYPHQLSVGQLQRASFVRALAHQPQLLLIDEPTAALDPAHGRQLLALIEEYCRTRQLLCLTVTHALELLQGFELYSYAKELSGPEQSVFVPAAAGRSGL